MSRKINLWYISSLEYFLGIMTDDELDEFHINTPSSIDKIIIEREKEFQKFGQKSKQQVLDGLEYLLVSNTFEEYWDYVISGHIPVDDVIDKGGFLLNLFRTLAKREPDENFDITDIELDNSFPEPLPGKGYSCLPIKE